MASSPTGRILGSKPLLASNPYRSAGKSSLLGAMYGGPLNRAQTEAAQRMDPDDPMKGLLNYHLRGRDKRFGNIVTYKTNNQTLGLFLKDGSEIGTTGVWGDTASNGVFVVTWVRRHGTMKMKEAVACAMLLHEHVILLRAFEEE